MKKHSFFVAVGLTAVAMLGSTEAVKAQTSNYYAGQAVDGRSVNIDLNTISSASSKSVNFVYYLGNERVEAQANCEAGSWTTFPERVVNRPQSQATQNMLNEVCSYLSSSPATSTAVVFDPPSNVRVSPNGGVLCAVRQRTSINLYGSTGDWYYTDACGEMGVIHSSQIRF
jgi:hypothetical protein